MMQNGMSPDRQHDIFTPEAVSEAYSRIKPVLHKTPILTSTSFNSLLNPPMSIYFKAELFQKCGVFKFRGASNAISRLSDAALPRGVATHSSGNHSAALACAARERGIKCYVPANASKLKIEATKAYGAEITFVEHASERAKMCDEVAAKTGATIIPPYDFEDIILGQGTVMYEFQNQMKEEYGVKMDAVVIPVGGGGLLGGSAVACIGSGTRVFAAEPAIADDCARGFTEGTRGRLESTPTTIADGLRTEVGELNFGIINEHVERVFTVTEQQIAVAMRIIIERLKVVIEPSAAVAVAVLLYNEDFRTLAKKDGITNVGIVLEGGNIDTGNYEKMMPWIHLTTQLTD